MRVKETAEAILAYQPLFTVAECVFAVQNGTEDDGHHGDVLGDFTDLQAMAKLWLMRDEIIGDLNNFADLADAELGKDVSPIKAFVAKIEALEDNDE